ncbi:Adenylate cyclase [Chitinispirillum alkaliphilum]|nr:Adenylate cyclase [Chitinispirillum alkaliphilum]
MLLKSILPSKIADRLKQGEVLIADKYNKSSILFCDMVKFTSLSRTLEPGDLVILLNKIVTSFDDLSVKYSLEKIIYSCN